MGKATRWLKGLLGMKKEKDHGDVSGSLAPDKKLKKRWSFSKSSGKDVVDQIAPTTGFHVGETENEQNKHAIAVAAATAAAADAAVAAAQAAVAVVRLTSHGRDTLFSGSKGRLAAVKIQTLFRGYLARKALRALKGLVKIQALVRGYLVRKRAAATLHSMQALIRAQAAVRSQRARRSMSKESRFQSEIRARKYMERFDETRSEFHSKRLPTSYETSLIGFDESPKIVEVDTYRPQSRSRRIITTVSESGEDLPCEAISSPLVCPVSYCQHLQDFEWYFNGDECRFSTAQNTPRFANCVGHNNTPATPVKSVCGDTFLRPYSNFPNYMSNTQSFRAKLRSLSAPKQRPEPKKRVSLLEMMAARNSVSGVRMQRSSTNPQAQQEYWNF